MPSKSFLVYISPPIFFLQGSFASSPKYRKYIKKVCILKIVSYFFVFGKKASWEGLWHLNCPHKKVINYIGQIWQKRKCSQLLWSSLEQQLRMKGGSLSWFSMKNLYTLQFYTILRLYSIQCTQHIYSLYIMYQTF